MFMQMKNSASYRGTPRPPSRKEKAVLLATFGASVAVVAGLVCNAGRHPSPDQKETEFAYIDDKDNASFTVSLEQETVIRWTEANTGRLADFKNAQLCDMTLIPRPEGPTMHQERERMHCVSFNALAQMPQEQQEIEKMRGFLVQAKVQADTLKK